jgi:hypothetical protein
MAKNEKHFKDEATQDVHTVCISYFKVKLTDGKARAVCNAATLRYNRDTKKQYMF